jgi:HTH-type transcriptional regulator/antitoxin HigA
LGRIPQFVGTHAQYDRNDDDRDALVTPIEAYENKRYDFEPADPVEAVKFRLEQEGLTPRDLEPYIGQSGRISEVLTRRRPLSLRIVKKPRDGLKIPYESLMAGVPQGVDRCRAPQRGRRESSLNSECRSVVEFESTAPS